MRVGQPKRCEEKKSPPRAQFWLLSLCFFLLPLSLPCVNWASQEGCFTWESYSSPWIFLRSISAGFPLLCLLATAILDSFFLFYLPNNYIQNHIWWASLLAQLVKKSPANWETWARSLGWEDPLEEDPFQHPFPGNPTYREAWGATVHRAAKSRTRLSDFHSFTHDMLIFPGAIVLSISLQFSSWRKESCCS